MSTASTGVPTNYCVEDGLPIRWNGQAAFEGDTKLWEPTAYSRRVASDGHSTGQSVVAVSALCKNTMGETGSILHKGLDTGSLDPRIVVGSAGILRIEGFPLLPVFFQSPCVLPNTLERWILLPWGPIGEGDRQQFQSGGPHRDRYSCHLAHSLAETELHERGNESLTSAQESRISLTDISNRIE